MQALWLVLTYDLLKDRHIDDVIIKSFFLYILILYFIKQIDSKLPCICSVIDHKWCQNVVAYHILMSSVIYYWTDAWQLGIYLLNNAFSLH